jgi:hypothetical protein
MFDEIAALSAPESLWLNVVGLICFGTFALSALFSPGAKLFIQRRLRAEGAVEVAITAGA